MSNYTPPEKVQVQGFSLYPYHLEMLKKLAEHHGIKGKSETIRYVIEASYERLKD